MAQLPDLLLFHVLCERKKHLFLSYPLLWSRDRLCPLQSLTNKLNARIYKSRDRGNRNLLKYSIIFPISKVNSLHLRIRLKGFRIRSCPVDSDDISIFLWAKFLHKSELSELYTMLDYRSQEYMNLTGQTSFCDEQGKESGDMWMAAWRPPGSPCLGDCRVAFSSPPILDRRETLVGALNLRVWLDLYYVTDSLYAFTGLLYLFKIVSYCLPATAPTSETQKYNCLVGGEAHPGPGLVSTVEEGL